MANYKSCYVSPSWHVDSYIIPQVLPVTLNVNHSVDEVPISDCKWSGWGAQLLMNKQQREFVIDILANLLLKLKSCHDTLQKALAPLKPLIKLVRDSEKPSICSFSVPTLATICIKKPQSHDN